MNREEQIIKIGAQFAIDETDGQTSGRAASMRGVLLSAFKAGAHWADQHPNWIPVEELVPDLDDDVLVYDSAENRMFVAHHAGDWYTTHGDILLGVTHWMPLPPAPRKEDNNA